MKKSSRGVRLTRDEQYERILGKADELFRQYGFGKTTVADIAQELGMSSANIYKFFPSKDALVQASADRSLAMIRREIAGIVRSPRSVAKRIESMALAVFHFHQELFRNERNIFKMVIQAHQEGWESVESYHAFLHRTTRKLLEEGMAAGEIRTANASPLTTALLDALHVALHPHLRLSWDPHETDRRVRAHIKFTLAALK